MKVRTWFEYSGEVEVDITSDDIQTALTGDDNRMHHVRATLSNVAVYLNGITDEMIDEYFDYNAKSIVREFLKTQLKRFGG